MPAKPTKDSKHGNKREKNVSKTCVSPKAIVDANPSSALDLEVKNQFELELCWCIQHLEASLASGKLQKKQTQDAIQYLNSLKNNTVPLIKKRQIMRNTFGDYRQKMVEDERKLSRIVSTVKFTSPVMISKKSLFIKKAIQHDIQGPQKQIDGHKIRDTLSVDTKRVMVDIDRIQTPFQFNFQICQ